MARSINQFIEMQRSLPHKALLQRDDPFCRTDREEFDQACRRVADGTECLVYAGSRGAEVGCLVICFASPLMSEDMQTWIEASGIATRPLPHAPAGAVQPKIG